MRKTLCMVAAMGGLFALALPSLATGSELASVSKVPVAPSMVARANPAEGGNVLWDNGDTDGSNGYSNGVPPGLAARRTLLDDFEIPAGEFWSITDFHNLALWNTVSPGSGTDFELTFREDNSNTPGNPIVTATTVSYSEMTTGRIWFSREEYETDYHFEKVTLGPGKYWIEGNVVGPENNFWMIREQVTKGEAWVNYDDLGGFQSGTQQFGAAADLSFTLTGTVVPEPSSLGIMALCGLFTIFRRRR